MTYSLAGDARRAVRERMFGSNGCARCGESNPIALVCIGSGRTAVTLCATCDARADGRSTWEAHHPLGVANGEWTILVTASLHRHFTHLQRDWPVATLTNSKGVRLLRIASGARFVHDASTLAFDALAGTRCLERMVRLLVLIATITLAVARSVEECYTTRIDSQNQKEKRFYE